MKVQGSASALKQNRVLGDKRLHPVLKVVLPTVRAVGSLFDMVPVKEFAVFPEQLGLLAREEDGG